MFRPETIGTPLSASATSVMLLGSGELSRELAISLQRLGVEVHAVDRVPNAPAQQVSHVAHVVDVTDPEAVTQLINEVRPDFIVSEIETIAADVLEAAEAADIATVVPSAKAAALSTNREGLRRLADQELGLPTTTYQFVSTFEELDVAVGTIGYPCIAKPDLGGPGAKDHRIIEDESEVTAAWQYFAADDANPRLIVEKVVDFDYEITLLTVRSVDPATGKPATWFCEPISYSYRGGEYVETWQPMSMSTEALENARSVAARVCNSLGGRGVVCVKLFVSGDDVYFSEAIPRPHDTGLVTMCAQRYSQFDLHARAILGLPIDVTLTSPGATSALLSPIASNELLYSGLTEALSVPESAIELFGKKQATVGRRMGVALATADNVATALDRARECRSAIKILDVSEHRP